MLVKEQKVEIQCAKVKNLSTSGEHLHLGTPNCTWQRRTDWTCRLIFLITMMIADMRQSDSFAALTKF